MTEKVSELKHYMRIGMLSVRTPFEYSIKT